MRGALAACLLAACAPPPPPAPIAATLPSAASSAEVIASAAPPPAAVPPRGHEVELTVDAEVARLSRALRGVVSNVEPRPVERGFAQVTTVQYRTDRRTPGAWTLVESPTMGLHHPPAPAEPDEPCRQPLAPGARVKGARGLGVELRVVGGAHELWVGAQKPLKARLPVGASHGACLGPDGTRAWVSWSTRATPPELFSVSLRDGNARPLRSDARPRLAWVASRRAPRLGRSVTLFTEGPEAAWSALGALLDAVGFEVTRARLAAGEAPRVVADARTFVVTTSPEERCDSATVLIGAPREALVAAAERGDCGYSVADGEDPVPDAWARVVALAARD